MKRFIFLCALISGVIAACKKGNTPQENTPTSPVTVGNTTTYSGGYVVKTLGVSQIFIEMDGTAANNWVKIKMWGGGNCIILKPGTGNTIKGDAFGPSIIPDSYPSPDAMLYNLNKPIDNGVVSDTTGNATIIKIKGFDKQKTGYNQLNIVLHKYLWVQDATSVYDIRSFKTNLCYLNYAGTKANHEYGYTYLTQLFSGNVAVSTVEIAKAKADHPYITEDQVLDYGAVNINDTTKKTTIINLSSFNYRTVFTKTTNIETGTPLQYEWVNANTGTVKALAADNYVAYFDKMRNNAYNIIEPQDTVSNTYLRIRGFNAEVTGFNQLRLFPAKGQRTNDGGMYLFLFGKPYPTVDLALVRNAFTNHDLKCSSVHPNWQYY